MALRYLDDAGYSLGMVRDLPSWMLPNGAVYDAQNFVFDQPGIARQRGGTTALVSGAQTAAPTTLGFCYSTDATTIEELYGINGKANNSNGYVINKTTGAFTMITFGFSGAYGRPVRHFGFLCFPSTSNINATYNAAWVAGQTTSTIYTTTVASNIVAGNPQITLTGADVTTNVQIGAIVYGFTATNYYVGRVVSIDTTKLFTVWPTPTVTFSPAGANLITAPSQGQVGTLLYSGGACAASFQNRMLFGGVNQQGTTPAVTPITRYDRRVSYSPLPTEQGGFNGDTAKPIDGATFLWRDQWPALNYFDVPGADPIVAMEPTADNELLILTSTHPVIFRGNLVTQRATTNPTITFDISDLNQPAGCLGDLSVHRTPKGIVWAGAGGIYVYNGRTIRDLTGDDDTKLINGYWRSLTTDAAFVLHGAVYVRGHYIVSGTSGGVTFSLAADLTGSRVKWTRFSGAGTDIFYGLARPTSPGQVYALRWWDVAGSNPSMTNGQTVRLESMLAPYVTGSGKADADGSAVALSLTTRVITGDAETQKVFQRGTIRYQASQLGANITVTAQSKIDAADIQASSVRALGSLSATQTSTITNATNANPIVVTTSVAHGLQDDDFVDIDGVVGNLNANGRWRIDVLSTTTFSLVGGVGSAAYSSGGFVKKLTESDFQISSLNAGQGASVTIASSGVVNNFELHGVRLAAFEKAPVMSA